jgi:hypothetical protein
MGVGSLGSMGGQELLPLLHSLAHTNSDTSSAILVASIGLFPGAMGLPNRVHPDSSLVFSWNSAARSMRLPNWAYMRLPNRVADYRYDMRRVNMGIQDYRHDMRRVNMGIQDYRHDMRRVNMGIQDYWHDMRVNMGI